MTVSEILTRFKAFCRSRGWKTSDNEDWVEADQEYHNFLWARSVHLSSFRRIVAKNKCVVREGPSYRVVEASYMAWLFSETPCEDLIKAVSASEEVQDRIALYDLSPLLEGGNMCVKLNHTRSSVFREFESFLKNEFGVRLKTASPGSNPAIKSENCNFAAVA